MVYRSFLPTIEKGNEKTQLYLFQKSNHEKRPRNNQGFSGYNLVELFFLVLGEIFWFKDH